MQSLCRLQSIHCLDWLGLVYVYSYITTLPSLKLFRAVKEVIDDYMSSQQVAGYIMLFIEKGYPQLLFSATHPGNVYIPTY